MFAGPSSSSTAGASAGAPVISAKDLDNILNTHPISASHDEDDLDDAILEDDSVVPPPKKLRGQKGKGVELTRK
jgi:hypothetical protein